MLMPRVAIICDYREEGWPSMDLVGDMLFQHLDSLPVQASRICPPMPRRFSRWNSVLWNADRFLARFWDYPRLLRGSRESYDVYHVVDHSYAHLVHELPAERTVITCHDLDTFECLLEPDGSGRSAAFRAMTQRILEGFRRAARIVCVSRATRDAIGVRGLADPARLIVVENGVDPTFLPDADPVADRQAVRWLGPPRSGCPELLHVGSTAPRKRIDMLLRIFAEVRKDYPGARLIRVGGFTAVHRMLIEKLDLSDAVVELPFVPTNVLASVYRRASVVLLPSSSEGFGLPLVEALACGTSVISSDLAVFREVGGSAAEYCPVEDVDAWAHTIRRQLDALNSAEQQREKRQANLVQARRYSWRRNAQEMATVYKDLFQTHHA